MLPHFADRGPRDGWPVLFVHGFPFDQGQWVPQVEALRGSHRTVTFDLRGLGASPPGPGPLMIEFLVDDLIELLDHLGIARATLCGLSMGGYVALRAVDRHPERVHGLVLCDTKATADDNAGRLKRAAAIRAIRAHGMARFADTMLPALFGADVVAAEGAGVAAIRRQIAATDPEGACQALGAMACRLDLSSRLSAIETPTLIVVGEDDTITPPSDARSMKDAIRHARLVEIPDAGHVSNLAQPEAFNAALGAFLAALGENDRTA